MAERDKYPTLPEYLAQVRERAKTKAIADPDFPERVKWLDKAAVISGVEWNDDHAVGAVHTTATLLSALKSIHETGMIRHADYQLVCSLISGQEDYAAAMGGGLDG